MALRQIVKLGESSDVLRERAREVTEFNEKLVQLVEDMFDTMFHADGVGLAAPQIGLLRRVIVVSVDGGENKYAVINPVITKQSGTQHAVEGCLSVPGRSGTVERPKKVTVEGFDAYGKPLKIKAEGYLAIAFCHEIDHLNGVLFVDKIVADED